MINIDILKFLYEKNIYQGIAVTYISNEWNEIFTYGYSDAIKKREVTKDTLFEIASLSKAFTAIAIYRLIYQKKLSLQDKVCDYITEWKNNIFNKNYLTDIKVKDLLYHTSGIDAKTISLSACNDDNDIKVIVQKLRRIKMKYKPGQKMLYASINYDILAHICEIVTNIKFQDYLEKMIFPELGLHNTYACRYNAIKTGRLSKGYKKIWRIFYPAKCYAHKVNVGSGYIISSIEDINRWLQIQIGIVKDVPAWVVMAVEESHKPNKEVKDKDTWYYGGGWYVHMRKPNIYHVGNNPNFSSAIIINLLKKTAVSVLVNCNISNIYDICNATIRGNSSYSEKKLIDGAMQLRSVLKLVFILIEILVLILQIIQKISGSISCVVLFFLLFGSYFYLKIKTDCTLKLLMEWEEAWLYGIIIIYIFILLSWIIQI